MCLPYSGLEVPFRLRPRAATPPCAQPIVAFDLNPSAKLQPPHRGTVCGAKLQLLRGSSCLLQVFGRGQGLACNARVSQALA